jgi:hypothetical protein
MGKRKIDDYVFLPGVSYSSNAYPNAYSLIQANKEFIKAEAVAYIDARITEDNAENLYPNSVSRLINNKEFIKDEIIAWVAARVAGGGPIWSGYTYSEASCRRDTGLLLDAITYDVRYGGNEKTIDIARNFWQGGVAQLISPTQEILGFEQIFTIITDYILPGVTYVSEQSPVVTTQSLAGSNGEAGVATNITNNLKPIIIDVIDGGLSTLPATVSSIYNYAGYVYDDSKCDRDIGLVIDAYLHDLRYGGNARIYYIASRFWNGSIPQLSGDRLPEITAQTFVRNLINNNIITKTIYTSEQSPVTEAQVTTGTVGEAGAASRITSLSNSFIAVLQNGLDSLPTLANGVSTIRLLGKFDINDLLLITNSTSNTVLFNFAAPSLGASVIVDTGYVSNFFYKDNNFGAFRDRSDYVTTIYLEADTSSATAFDDIQIFVEEKETRVRPYDYGTDAIERMRVAASQSMLDADFEYGLQPTKWQAIGLLRGYPSSYEVPGSDTSVVNVTTDASTGNAITGVGSSLITVTTSGAHGFTLAMPFTIKALANTITGFSRAEGTFLVNSIPTATTFTYYATAKVGSANGQVLATTYTQLRKAEFYTGAPVGSPVFSVATNGTTGTIDTVFSTTISSNRLAFTGTAPSTGSPITGTGIDTGTQVSGVIGSGGIVATQTVNTTVSSGATSIVFDSVSGIAEGSAIDNGSGTSIFVTQIVGSTVSLSGPTTVGFTGGAASYSSVSGTTVAASGSSATFNVTRTNNVYDTVTINNAGTGYNIGDQLTIEGTSLEGTSPTNDITVTVSSIGGSGTITAITFTGTSVVKTFTYSNISQDFVTAVDSTATGTGATWNIIRSDLGDSSAGTYAVSLNNAGTDYNIGDVITILGTNLGGSSPTNDLEITVITLGVSGSIVSFSYNGDAVGTDTTFTALTANNVPNNGSGAQFTISKSAGSYTISAVSVAGSNYRVGNKILILGSNLGGTSPANDLLISVTAISGSGISSAIVVTGTATLGSSISFYSVILLSSVTTAIIPTTTTLNYSGIALIEVSFSTAHGLIPGASITTRITSTGSNHSLAAGPFFVEQVPSVTSLRYTARTAGTVDTAVALTGIIYTRSDAYFVHRPYDGGVQLGTGGPQHGSQAIRMSKKYIRYQSGKGVNYCTGALFAPSVNIQSATADDVTIGSDITFVMDDVDHGLQIGSRIKILGIETFGYNGTYTVTEIINERQFKVLAQTVLANTTAVLGPNALMATYQWHGATVRAGTHDDQNGLFFQYDGNDFAVVRRSSTQQLAGVVSITKDTNLMTGVNTRFRDQIKAGDRIVIKGMTHVVTRITSQTSMTVAPDYRGAVDAVAAKICLVSDYVVKQQDFNIDRLDGTGPSGFNIDITKMQMIGMQWSWYAVGFIDFMLRGSDGNFIFFHRMRNSNVNTEAYMRTGNQPVRYEVHNESARGKLASSISAAATSMPLVDASDFPNETAVVYIDNELISYNGKSGNTLLNCTRSASLTSFIAGALRTFTAGSAATHEYNTGVILVSCTTSPIISHWGSAFLMDGLFDEDRGYIFSYASTGVSVSTTKQTAFLIRLAPSISNAIVGDLGERELLNRAQLLLKGIAITSDTGSGGIVVEGVLNPSNYPTDPSQISWGGLSSLAAGGQPSFAQIAPGGSVTWNSGAQTTAGATLQTDINGNLTVPNNSVFNRSSGSSFFYATQASWTSIGASTGLTINDGKYPSGTTITTISASPSPTATTIDQLTTGNVRLEFDIFFGGNQYFARANDWSNNVNPVSTVGMTINGGGFPSGTFVTSVSSIQSGSGRTWYTLTMSATTIGSSRDSNATFSLGGTYSNNLDNLYFTSSSWNNLPLDCSIVGASTNDATTFPTPRTITTINTGRSFAGTTYTRVVFSGVAASISGSRTITFSHTPYYQVNTSLNSTSSVNAAANVQLSVRQSTGNTNFVFFTSASWTNLVNTNNAGVGTEVSIDSSLTMTNFIGTGTTTVTGTLAATANVIGVGNRITISGATGTEQTKLNGTWTVATVGATTFTFVVSTSVVAGILTTTLGTTTLLSDFPAGTRISNVSTEQTFNGTTYYRIQFNQTSISAQSPAEVITFRFGQPPYALPGETVFSFISQPGESGELDLAELKELTNTTLGGRGTYPNGPDVLAINVYKASGTTVNSNIILRWGEAQA